VLSDINQAGILKTHQFNAYILHYYRLNVKIIIEQNNLVIS